MDVHPSVCPCPYVSAHTLCKPVHSIVSSELERIVTVQFYAIRQNDIIFNLQMIRFSFLTITCQMALSGQRLKHGCSTSAKNCPVECLIQSYIALFNWTELIGDTCFPIWMRWLSELFWTSCLCEGAHLFACLSVFVRLFMHVYVCCVRVCIYERIIRVKSVHISPIMVWN